MNQVVSVSGYCPIQKCNYMIDVVYQSYGTNGQFLQTGADCEYASFNGCSMQLSCPLRASTPKNKTF